MRVYRFDELTGVDGLRRHDEEMPRPQRGELLLKVRAVSLNYRDIAIARKEYVRPAAIGLIPCSDAAAEVVETGEGVEDFAVGDRVLGIFHPRWFGGPMPPTAAADSYGSGQDGWLAEYKVVSREAVVPLPDSLSDEAGCTLPCAATTAWTALGGPLPIRAGQTVLTLGSGGVSVFAVQLAKALGARVVATTSSAAKGEILRSLGADEIVDYTEVPQWGRRVRELTGGRGVDRVVEVGGPATIDQSLRAVAQGGEVTLIGFLSRENPGVDFFLLRNSGALTRSITVGHRGDLQNTIRAVTAAHIAPVIDEVYDFDDAPSAFTSIAEARHVGKIVIRVS
ncbi:NADPH:quinone oxidoreductase [Mycolicibacterium madagascariense]|uniref:NADPH:quinone oxidoreductase n=1 Tax=Mycolicibacterium madagascariense TaxID=212765 RepID=A0A7I7XA78_9MYCO|nr:NAD(P)-dependent alcohol dehydrogenase [Mycolicibacterium madagascariense]MCV7014764.1 NAD(P)-dependent alcohol dehydrogenase [Mycolicibacterium madagascariense]BBZ26474.1 NADPH:quinone oxidoreductase [Mycolicibacterium madagascariense]